MRMRSPKALLTVAIMFWAPLVGAQNVASKLPAACAACKPAGFLGLGIFADESRRLLSHPLPTERRASDARVEPWIFILTVNLDGTPCEVRLIKGPDGSFSKMFTASVMKWSFTPLTYKGHTACHMSRLYCYVRLKDGRPVLVIPGVTEPY